MLERSLKCTVLETCVVLKDLLRARVCLLTKASYRKPASPLSAPRTTWENVQSQKKLIRFGIDRLGLAKSSDINTGTGEVGTFPWCR